MPKKLTIKEMHEIANKHGGKCLSQEYVNSQIKLKWQCSKGHIWEAKPYSIIADHWCPYCANRKKLTIQQMEKIARDRGGKCLSSEYIGNHKNLTWQCSEGHVWNATPHSVKQGTWCPYCSNRTKLGERITRAYFELIFNEKFPKKRPNWLKNEQGLKLELDGFCLKLKLAFEYQGIQHFEEHKWFHQKRDFEQQKKLDALKKKLCSKNKVVLISIPYNVEYKNIQKYIVKECKKKNIDVPEKINFVGYKSLGVYSLNLLNEMKKIAKEHGGKCLSSEYIDSETKLEWQCKEGHVWKAISKSVKRGKWCPICARINTANKLRGNINKMKKLAERKGGKCLSKKYIDNSTKLKWQCSKGHIWYTTPNRIQQGTWCPICGHKKGAEKQKNTIEDMKKLARSKGGECLSDNYVNNKTKLTWKCENGHIWKSRPNDIKNGYWCPYCSGNIKLTIEDMQRIALERGGWCLSMDYINNKTALWWQCGEGHVWFARPDSVKNNGTWCPICNKKPI